MTFIQRANSPYGSMMPRDSLTAIHWTFEESDSGASGFANHGSGIAIPIYPTGGGRAQALNYRGKRAVRLVDQSNGLKTDDPLSAGQQTAFEFSDVWTASIWFYNYSLLGESAIYVKSYNAASWSSPFAVFGFHHRGGGDWSGFSAVGGFTYDLETSVSTQTNTNWAKTRTENWHMFAMTYNSSTTTLKKYIDGVLNSTKTGALSYNTHGGFYVGCNPAGQMAPQYFADARWEHAERSAAYLAQAYALGYPQS